MNKIHEDYIDVFQSILDSNTVFVEELNAGERLGDGVANHLDMFSRVLRKKLRDGEEFTPNEMTYLITLVYPVYYRLKRQRDDYARAVDEMETHLIGPISKITDIAMEPDWEEKVPKLFYEFFSKPIDEVEEDFVENSLSDS